MAAVRLDAYQERILDFDPLQTCGKIVDVVGLTLQATGPAMNIGDFCYVVPLDRSVKVPVEVVGFRDDRILLMPLGNLRGIGPGSFLIPTGGSRSVRVGTGLLGRVLGCLGEPIDGAEAPPWEAEVPLQAAPPEPLSRPPIRTTLSTGVRVIDGCITCGRGQRVAIISGSGVGKSKLIGMIARNTNADVNVIALIGERGREVREFIEKDLGAQGLENTVVVVATSDEPALRRINGAYTATAIAEWFRAQGKDVLLMMDSVTRFAMAQREVGLAIGEPPTSKGYPPSVYALLPKLLERAGTNEEGSITGFYNVLVEADDLNDPVGDMVRSIVDGHISLSRELAGKGHYPAVDVLQSVSRSMLDVVGTTHQELARELRSILGTYRDAEDLVNIGAYAPGSNPEIDRALRLMPLVEAFTQQGLFEESPFEGLEEKMASILRR
jgi:flagellum-specific ATP synthase